MTFWGVGYSGICMCAATEFAALEPLHGVIHVQQDFATPCSARTCSRT